MLAEKRAVYEQQHREAMEAYMMGLSSRGVLQLVNSVCLCGLHKDMCGRTAPFVCCM